MVYILNIDRPEGSFAIVNQNIPNIYTSYETAVIFNEIYRPKELHPNILAHEILHTFGAIDLYNNPIFDAEFVEHSRNDIMRNAYFDINVSYISNLTAFLIGWTDELEDKYKEILED